MGVPSAAVVAIMENKGGISASSQKGMKVGPSAKKRRKQPDDAALDRSPRDPKKAKKADGEADAAPPKAAAETPPQSAEEFRKSHSMKVTGINPVPEPWMTFQQTTFAAPLRRALESAGYTSPTPTQCQSWPMVSTGRDLISIAKTGSGKTVAFLLPSMQSLLNSGSKKSRGRGARVLVLAPTRELALQIEEDANKFGRAAGLVTVCCYGGSSKFPQIRGLEEGCDVLVATPGRLSDLFEMGKVTLTGVEILVLDEADRMLDMGFEPQIKTIIAHIPQERQTLMFTATWPKQVQRMAATYLHNPATIAMGEQGVLHANKNITQHVYLMGHKEKEGRLTKLLGEIGDAGKPYEFPKTIIFAAKKHVVQSIADKLWGTGMAVDSLHGDKEQWERTKVIEAFKDTKARDPLRLLVATDVAARGLDVKDVRHVINFDFPSGKGSVEDYVHRIGRTGRAGATGDAHTFFDPNLDGRSAHELVTILKRAEQEVPEELLALASSAGPSRGGGNRWRGGGGQGGGRGRRGGGRGGGRGGFKRW